MQNGANSRQPVSNDEESERAVLAEIERDIFQGMEVLEDAFEALHQRAEVVRAAIRQRGFGLTYNLQNRRRVIDVLPGSGNSAGSGYERPGWAAGSDGVQGGSDEEWWGGPDDFGDILPDDSVSNISSSRYRRPKRRHERKTPAPIEEEEDEEDD
jgi:hypothetical protein